MLLTPQELKAQGLKNQPRDLILNQIQKSKSSISNDHLDAFDLGYNDGLEGNYKNPFDELSSMCDKYDLGFDTGRAAK